MVGPAGGVREEAPLAVRSFRARAERVPRARVRHASVPQVAGGAWWIRFGEEAEGTDGKEGTFSHSHNQHQHHHAGGAVAFTNGGASSGIAAAGKQLLRTGISSGSVSGV